MYGKCAVLILVLAGVVGCGETEGPLAPTQVEAFEARPTSMPAITGPAHDVARQAPRTYSSQRACPPRPACRNLRATRRNGLIVVKYSGECHTRRWDRFTVRSVRIRAPPRTTSTSWPSLIKRKCRCVGSMARMPTIARRHWERAPPRESGCSFRFHDRRTTSAVTRGSAVVSTVARQP